MIITLISTSAANLLRSVSLLKLINNCLDCSTVLAFTASIRSGNNLLALRTYCFNSDKSSNVLEIFYKIYYHIIYIILIKKTIVTYSSDIVMKLLTCTNNLISSLMPGLSASIIKCSPYKYSNNSISNTFLVCNC